MATAIAVAAFGPRAARSARDRRVVAWTAFAAGVAIAGIGAFGDSPVVLGIGAVLIAALSGFLAPQFLLAVFLVAGGLKGAPWLAGVPADLTVLTAAGLMVAMGVRATKPDGIHPFPPATVFAVGMVGITLLSVLWSPAPDIGLVRALRFATFTMVAFFAPLVLIRSRADLKRLLTMLAGGALVIALTSIPGESPNQPRIVPGGSEIELALYSSLGAVAIVGYLVLLPGSRWRILWLIPAAVLVNTMIGAGSRGVLVASIVALLVVAVMAIAGSRAKIIALGVVAVAVAVALVFASNLTGPAATKYAGLVGAEGSVNIGKRNFLVRDGIDLALEYPLGRGVGGYQFETGIEYPWPHNIFVEAAAEEGIIGLALLLALVAAAARSSLRAREGPFSPESIVAVGLLIVVVGDCMVSQSFTTFRPLWFVFGLALAVPWIGAKDESEAGEGEGPPEPSEPPPARPRTTVQAPAA